MDPDAGGAILVCNGLGARVMSLGCILVELGLAGGRRFKFWASVGQSLDP